MDPVRLTELLEGVPGSLAEGTEDPLVSGVAYRSDRVRPGDVFFCIPGFEHDGHDFAPDAVERGAAALVVKRELDWAGTTPRFLAEDPRAALAAASARIYGRPSERLTLIGITGTNGKTTTTFLADSVLRAGGHVTGLLGTVQQRVGSETRSAARTTPESKDLQAILREMVDAGVTAATMEVSSHAIDLHRVDHVTFGVTAFTNLTQDHLDYHSSFEEYFAVKSRLFSGEGSGTRVINVDDEYGATLASDVGVEWPVGFGEDARVRATDVALSATSSEFVLRTPEGDARVELPLAGRHNVSNALVAAACGLAAGVDLAAVARGLGDAPQVPGRLERIDCGQGFNVFVDYAHTPDALEKAIEAVREVTAGRVITVFGCGGDRDPEKRPLMGAAAGRLSDAVVVTTDNPRTEDPIGIILRIEDGLKEVASGYEVEVDRRRAIQRALGIAAAGDSVLIAGKGHEDYQILGDRTIHFDDREVVREGLSAAC